MTATPRSIAWLQLAAAVLLFGLGALLGLLGMVVVIDPLRFDWSDHAIVQGHAWLLLAGLSSALAVLHERCHRWRMAPLDVLPWQMSVATILLWILSLVIEKAVAEIQGGLSTAPQLDRLDGEVAHRGVHRRLLQCHAPPIPVESRPRPTKTADHH